jgi:hypothetical protein
MKLELLIVLAPMGCLTFGLLCIKFSKTKKLHIGAMY